MYERLPEICLGLASTCVFGFISFSLSRLLRQLDGNTRKTEQIIVDVCHLKTDVKGRIDSLVDKMETMAADIVAARELRTEVKILANEFRTHSHPRRTNGNGKFADTQY